MAREMYGVTALDPRVAATERFIQDKQIPPDQVENFLLSMGADPKLASLVFKYRRVQEAAKQQQQGQPPTASVDQEVSNQYAQLKQQERMGQGVAGMAAPNLARAPMQGGITGQPMPRMAGGGIVAFAKGGKPPRVYEVDPEGNVDIGSAGDLIPYEAPARPSRTAATRAAMSRGLGALARFPLKHPFLTAGLAGAAYLLSPDEEEAVAAEEAKVEQAQEGLTDEDIRLLASADKERPAAQGVESRRGVSAPPKREAIDISPLEDRLAEAKGRLPKDEQAAIDAELAREKPYLESLAARRAKIEEQEKAGTTSSEKKFWMAFAQAGFAASAKGARNLWETLSIGGVEGMKAYESMKEKEQQLRERLQDKRFQLDDLEAQVKRGATKAGVERLDKLRAEVTAAQGELTRTEVAIGLAEQSEAGANYRAALAQEGADRRAAMAASARANKQKLEEQYYADIAAAQRTTDPKLKAAYLRRAEDTRRAKEQLEQTESGYQSTQARLAADAAYMPQGDGFGNPEQIE